MSFGERGSVVGTGYPGSGSGFTGAKYRGLVNRVDTSNPDRPEHQPDKIVLLISNQWHINCTSSDSN